MGRFRRHKEQADDVGGIGVCDHVVFEGNYRLLSTLDDVMWNVSHVCIRLKALNFLRGRPLRTFDVRK